MVTWNVPEIERQQNSSDGCRKHIRLTFDRLHSFDGALGGIGDILGGTVDWLGGSVSKLHDFGSDEMR